MVTDNDQINGQTTVTAESICDWYSDKHLGAYLNKTAEIKPGALGI